MNLGRRFPLLRSRSDRCRVKLMHELHQLFSSALSPTELSRNLSLVFSIEHRPTAVFVGGGNKNPNPMSRGYRLSIGVHDW